ncbi:FAD:protein FMN transferase [Sphingomonas sp. RS2018]
MRRFDGATMGTNWSAQVVAPHPDLEAALLATLSEAIAALSHWAPDSALSRFNRSPLSAWQQLPPMLAETLEAADAVHRASGGAFDAAGGALADIWGFGPSGPVAIPPDIVAIGGALARSGWDAIERDDDRARRTRDVTLDLSGIGKGRAVDALAVTCRGHGVHDFLVEIGGEIVGAGIQPDGQPWWVDLEAPPGLPLPPLRIAAHEVAIATSGDYRRYLTVDGRRLGHTIDPRTGRPVDSDVVSVSVVAGDCMAADAWATALTVLGVGEGLALAEREGLAARFVTGDGVETLSPVLAGMLE